MVKIMINTTFSAFLGQHLQGEHAKALQAILVDIEKACKKIAIAIDSGALEGNMGSLGSENIQGELQKALDVITNDIFIEAIQVSGYVAGMVSEELVENLDFAATAKQKDTYLVMVDPLDGSSNVNVNISVGTIFSIFKSSKKPSDLADYLQSGNQQLCAGYVMYGTSTMMVLTSGNGVNGFTLDHKSNEFYLTHPNMQIAEDTQEFSINMSNYRFWSSPVQRYIDECLQGEEGDREKDFNMRWVAAMVADVHRILVRGGIFMYPWDQREPNKPGKLRLMYEANPMSFLIEQAGGASVNGQTRILDIQPSMLHERVSVILGSENEVKRVLQYHHHQ
jgi:fructose-1,6-bisphosphatase I